VYKKQRFFVASVSQNDTSRIATQSLRRYDSGVIIFFFTVMHGNERNSAMAKHMGMYNTPRSKLRGISIINFDFLDSSHLTPNQGSECA